ncbi:hypothetical protein CO2235_180022 [Cupriavidus oxalaticus]|uniref:Uncharacterized protein n=1 Tax=Cupriavidus oxalaticus TaxID=96344 RepID=A0A375G173_9BURK|nr:hypothetical protein CO2235_180022 [Cupriavidus oxalaticus]
MPPIERHNFRLQRIKEAAPPLRLIRRPSPPPLARLDSDTGAFTAYPAFSLAAGGRLWMPQDNSFTQKIE